MKVLAGVFAAVISMLTSSAFAWEVTSETDDFSGKSKHTIAHLEGSWMFFFNCTSEDPQSLDLRIATTMDWEDGLKESLEVQFKGPDTPLVSILTSVTSNQTQKVLLVSLQDQQPAVLQLMKLISVAKTRISFRVSQDADPTKISTSGFQKAYRKIAQSCNLESLQAL